MTEERIEWHLWNWERWMRMGMFVEVWARASGHGNGTVGDFDEMVDAADRRCGETTDVCIDALPLREKASIYAKHLQGPWANDRESPLADVYPLALRDLGMMLDRRGLA